MLASVDKMEQPTPAYTGVSRAPNKYHPAGFWAAEMIRFLQANQDKPFCAWLSFYGPHTPIIPSAQWASMYDPDKITLPGNYPCKLTSRPRGMDQAQRRYQALTPEQHGEMLARYYGFVSQIDHNIGLVLDELQRLGLAENTVVVYTADHGEMAAEHGTWTKFTLNYDATVHVPLIIRVPNVLPSGAIVDELVGLVDLLPTLCELTGRPAPQKVQGKSLVALAQAQGGPVEWRDVIFSEIGYPGRAAGRCVLARTHTHAFIQHENYGQPFEELFDLTKDPWQTHNVADEEGYAAVLGSLKQAIDQWEKTTDHAAMIPVGPNPGRTRRSNQQPSAPSRRGKRARSR
ncbi:MAG: sulfatase-like hydrolase/transferase [Planctomycetes bacterium]|nr:sulfatase-like hydrolase/transferase [Planctomycetota bacterium]